MKVKPLCPDNSFVGSHREASKTVAAAGATSVITQFKRSNLTELKSRRQKQIIR